MSAWRWRIPRGPIFEREWMDRTSVLPREASEVRRPYLGCPK